MKRCPGCMIEKENNQFSRDSHTKDGLRCHCKECQAITKKEYYTKTAERQRQVALEWAKNNKDRRKTVRAKWLESNKAYVQEYRRKRYENTRERQVELAKEWRKKNPEKIKQIRQKKSLREQSSPTFRINHSVSSLIRFSLHDGKKNQHWEFLVGFTLQQLKDHLEKHFLPGMSWDNYGQWHIDHKIPVSAFNFEKPEEIDFKRCWALENLQPLWATDNVKKRNKLFKPFQPALLLEAV